MNSRLLKGFVKHERLVPVKHTLQYMLYLYCLDLDELEQLRQEVLFFGYNSFRPASIYDADYLDTEAHFEAASLGEKHYRPSGPELEPERALTSLLAHVERVAADSKAAPPVNALRNDLLTAALDAAGSPQGLFTLTAPTGAGKTLALLAFALKHAAEHDLRRIVVVIPYLTIIEQTTTQILQALDSRREEFTADPQLLRDVVREDLLPLIDLDYSARLILGKAGRGVSPEQLGAFSEAMSGVLINRYADGLIEFRSDEQIEVLPMKGNNTDKLTRVRTRIKLDNGGYAPVDYSFRKTEQGWKAFDVTVEGISYVITFRNQIAPRVEAEGIDKVTRDILAGNLKIDE